MKGVIRLRESQHSNFQKFKELMPGIGAKYAEDTSEVYKDGALDAKTKRLMALTGALVHGCTACILAQTDRALESGGSAEEIIEACAVAMSLGGTKAAGESTCVIQYLGELGIID